MGESRIGRRRTRKHLAWKVTGRRTDIGGKKSP